MFLVYAHTEASLGTSGISYLGVFLFCLLCFYGDRVSYLKLVIGWVSWPASPKYPDVTTTPSVSYMVSEGLLLVHKLFTK